MTKLPELIPTTEQDALAERWLELGDRLNWGWRHTAWRVKRELFAREPQLTAALERAEKAEQALATCREAALRKAAEAVRSITIAMPQKWHSVIESCALRIDGPHGLLIPLQTEGATNE